MLAAALILILTTCIPPAAQQPKPHSVQDFFKAGISAFNEHDLDAFMKQFAL